MLTEIVTGSLLTLFILIFFLYGGREIWEFVTRIVPTPNRRRVREAGAQAFGSLVGFVRATVGVAAVDAIGIGVGLAILGPLRQLDQVAYLRAALASALT